MKLVYIAGPYRGNTKEEIQANIDFARLFGRAIARLGVLFPVMPHSNSSLFDFIAPDITPEYWLTGDLILLSKCDAIFMLPGWKESGGALIEHRKAEELNIPIFYEFSELEKWSK